MTHFARRTAAGTTTIAILSVRLMETALASFAVLQAEKFDRVSAWNPWPNLAHCNAWPEVPFTQTVVL
jgi:hypothetical protein